MSDDKHSDGIIKGRAENAKGGAVVVTTDGAVFYMKGLPHWNEDIIGETVVVQGLISVEKLIPDPLVDEDGTISQGAEGMQTVISNATWKLSTE